MVRDSASTHAQARPPLVVTMKQLMLKGCQQQAIALFESSIDLADSRALTLAAKLYGKAGEVEKVRRCFEALDRTQSGGLTQVSIRVGLRALVREASWTMIICDQLVRKYPLVRIEPESFDLAMKHFPIGTARGLLIDTMFNPAYNVPWTDRHLVRIASTEGTVFTAMPAGSTDLTIPQLRECFGDKLVRPELKAIVAANDPVIHAICRVHSHHHQPLEIASNTRVDPLTHSALSRLGRSVTLWTLDGVAYCYDAQGGGNHCDPPALVEDPSRVIGNASGRIDSVFSSFRYMCSLGNTKSLSAMVALKKWLMSANGRYQPKRVFSDEEVSEGIDWIDQKIVELRQRPTKARV
ncbi:hypothetical protein Pmar_PMAR028282 [Perkinsus marinus ATCC 50983]|uniref:Uncharacterized protein n=1 Tax=Perkinsus marinus (strain ATCC 50983 / TXsc) TaxID=423536 RepID=C5LN33_PERM5|nr:hypothetical protein Pmar_PMAR028282 [Perkinsus marinus ATCC 50983]EER01832.1 hypothetical protein Pmar_PMAR028282 [Perkinsus marinus ATCC 50983]|eukprot:XP_002769114.1 hypothetical protein Pmar_PMAR028282 [Perkinsus marinus ATCC 50983]